MLGQQGEGGIAQPGLFSEIRRDIADSQPPLGTSIIDMDRDKLGQCLRVLAVPALRFPGDRLSVCNRDESAAR